jgi:gamma-glutamyl hercynylcysteine S-oxide synthase
MVGPSNVHVVTGSWQQTMSFEPPHIITVRWLEPRFSMRGIRRTSNDRTWHIHTNFFTGCGQVIWENIFGWWNPWTESERALFRRCNTILHAYADAFLDHDWQPYVPTLCAEVYAHEWHDHTTTVYTLLNTGTEIAEGALLSVHLPADEYRFINIWDGSEVAVSEQDGRSVLSFAIAPRSSCCIVAAPRTEAKLLPLVAPQAKPPQTIAESLACPGYLGLVSPQKTHEFPIDHQTRCSLDAYQPRPVAPTAPADPGDAPEGMIAVDGGRFVMLVRHSEDAAMEGACYGEVAAPRPINHPDFGPGFPAQSADHPPQYFWMKPFLIDRTEVTNEEFRRFLADTHYVPHDPTNFLRHWAKPAAEAERPWKWEIPAGGGRHPVVWVDLDDARAYAAWAEKRLPTEPEWQYAAQYTSDGLHRRRWPWGDAFERTRCNTDSAGTTPVDAYPAGASSLGILDLCGNVWEWTESERHDGHTRYAILRGGSYFRAEGSVWYRAGGAQPNDVHTKFLLMYPGLDRCATVGFRCVKDIKANG